MGLLDKKIEMAWDEYKILADSIIKYDDLMFKVKSWSIATFGVLLSIYFTKITDKKILFFQILISLLYWQTEYIYKKFQSFKITRSRLLEIFLNNIDRYEDYRIPDLLFKNSYAFPDENKILKKRGFIPGELSFYSQKIVQIKMFFSPQVSLLYICQIFCSIVIIVFF